MKENGTEQALHTIHERLQRDAASLRMTFPQLLAELQRIASNEHPTLPVQEPPSVESIQEMVSELSKSEQELSLLVYVYTQCFSTHPSPGGRFVSEENIIAALTNNPVLQSQFQKKIGALTQYYPQIVRREEVRGKSGLHIIIYLEHLELNLMTKIARLSNEIGSLDWPKLDALVEQILSV